MRCQGCKPQTTTETTGTLILRLLDKVTKGKKRAVSVEFREIKVKLASPNVGWDQ